MRITSNSIPKQNQKDASVVYLNSNKWSAHTINIVCPTSRTSLNQHIWLVQNIFSHVNCEKNPKNDEQCKPFVWPKRPGMNMYGWVIPNLLYWLLVINNLMFKHTVLWRHSHICLLLTLNMYGPIERLPFNDNCKHLKKTKQIAPSDDWLLGLRNLRQSGQPTWTWTDSRQVCFDACHSGNRFLSWHFQTFCPFLFVWPCECFQCCMIDWINGVLSVDSLWQSHELQVSHAVEQHKPFLPQAV